MSEVETETYVEWRLVGEMPNGERYDFTTSSEEQIRQIKDIGEKSEGRGWKDVKLTRREVTITRTPWIEVDAAGKSSQSLAHDQD